jgi:endonuclease/exonuclease/phosphatase family metal-dependent hydrolase
MTRRQVLRRPGTGEDVGPPLSRSSDKAPSEAQDGVCIRLLTHNIRYATDAPFKGEERWPVRCPLLCSELVFHSREPATFICLQEVLHSQLRDILRALNASASPYATWACIGVGRDDGKKGGEYSPIFYRPAVWKLEKWDTLWLSPTPRVPSKGWDAANPRIATIGHFEHSLTGQKVVVTTTHFDDQGVVSRKESAKMLLKVLDLEPGSIGASAVLLAGDFNSPPDDEAYKIMTAQESIMADVTDMVPEERHYGNEMTFTGFGFVDSTPSRIDFIFIRKRDRINFDTYAVLANRFDDRVYLSDHRACVADLHLLPES